MKTSNKLLLGFLGTGLLLIFCSFLLIDKKVKADDYVLILGRMDNAQKKRLKDYSILIIDGTDQEWEGVLYYDQEMKSNALAIEAENITTQRKGDTILIKPTSDSPNLFWNTKVFFLPNFKNIEAKGGRLFYYPLKPEGKEGPEIDLTLVNSFFKIGRSRIHDRSGKLLNDPHGPVFNVNNLKIKAHSSPIELRQVHFSDLHLEIDSVDTRYLMIQDQFSVDKLTGKISKKVPITANAKVREQINPIIE